MKTRITWLWLVLFTLCSFLSIAQKDSSQIKESEYTIEIKYTPDESKQLIKKSAVNLTSFHCSYSEKHSSIILEWKISNAEGKFDIEHSTDGISFFKIGSTESTILNQPFSYETSYYQTGINYYRIKQRYNDIIIFSEVKAVDIPEDKYAHFLKLYDENEKKRIELRVRDKQFVTIQLVDNQGNIMKELFAQTMESNEIIFRTFQKFEYKPGIYILLITGEKFKQRLIISLPN